MAQVKGPRQLYLERSAQVTLELANLHKEHIWRCLDSFKGLVTVSTLVPEDLEALQLLQWLVWLLGKNPQAGCVQVIKNSGLLSCWGNDSVEDFALEYRDGRKRLGQKLLQLHIEELERCISILKKKMDHLVEEVTVADLQYTSEAVEAYNRCIRALTFDEGQLRDLLESLPMESDPFPSMEDNNHFLEYINADE